MLPLWLKVSYLIFLCVLVPVYYKKYGPSNFLWFSDIALFGTGVALWLESNLIASMMAVGILLPELAWNVEFFFRLLTGKKLMGMSDYMFDKQKPLYLRALSLFHVILPVVMIYILVVLGYDERAPFYQILLSWLVLFLTYLLTDPEENINWAFGPGTKPQKKISAPLYLLVIMILVPLLIFVPSHFLLKWLFG